MNTSPGRERINTLAFMFVVTFVPMALVSGLQIATQKRVDTNAALFLRRAVMEASGQTVPKDPDEILRWYDQCVKVLPDSGAMRGFRITTPDGSRVTGYVFLSEGAGLWGKIRAATGMDENLETFTGVTFLEQNETPGLGARIDEPWFKQQIRGKTGPLALAAEGTRSGKPEEMDAITGATITSKGVQGILNAIRAKSQALKPPRT